MPEHSHQPQSSDAVLGGQDSTLLSGAVLGGIEGIKQRLASGDARQRIAALQGALKYGQDGLEQLMYSLEDEFWSVQRTAYSLLLENAEPVFERALRVYNPYSQFKCFRSLSAESSVNIKYLIVSSNEQTLATANYWGHINLWNLHSGQLKSRLIGDSFQNNAIAISPDGKILASCGERDKTIKLWNVDTGELRSTLEEGFFQKIVSHPEGQILASWVYGNRIIKLWNVDTGELRNTLNNESGITSIDFSPDGRTLASSYENTIKLWNVNTGGLRSVLTGDGGLVSRITFSPDGEIVATINHCGSRYGGRRYIQIKLWDLHSGKQKVIKDFGYGMQSFAFSPDGQTLAVSTHDNTIYLLDVDNQLKTKRTLKVKNNDSFYRNCSFAFNPDSLTLASSRGDTINLWDTNTGKLVTTLRNGCRPIAFRSDGQILISASSDNSIKLWGTEKSTLSRLPPAEFFQHYLALKEALESGDTGLELVLQALNDESWQVQEVARLLLEERTEPVVKHALQQQKVSYIWLEYLLTNKRWTEANEETKVIMLRLAGQEKEGRLSLEDFKNLPCQDLCTINQLWTLYSNGHYGFSPQKQVWESVLCREGERMEKNCNEVSTAQEFQLRLGWLRICSHPEYHGVNDQFLDDARCQDTRGYFPRTDEWIMGSIIDRFIGRLEECGI